MATPRSDTGARSAVGALLEASAAATAMTPLRVSQPDRRQRQSYRKRQVILDDRTDITLQELTDSLRRVTGTRLTTSHAVRAMLRMVEPALPRLSTAKAPAEATCLPNNAARFAEDRARFEQALRLLIGEALRVTG